MITYDSLYMSNENDFGPNKMTLGAPMWNPALDGENDATLDPLRPLWFSSSDQDWSGLHKSPTWC